jgi:iron complex transport system ATP-binding protein
VRLHARDIAVGHGPRDVLSGVELALGPGELVGLIGPNGAGKSTLMRVLAGLDPPRRGRVLLDDRELYRIAPAQRARSIAYLAQGGDVHWPMRAAAVVALGRLPHRGDGNEAQAVSRAMQAADIMALRDRPVDTLSGGERMRVLLARALAVEAPLLLADEPIAELDPLHQLRVMSLLLHTARRGAGVMAVLHELSLAARFCDRLLLVGEGRLLASGPPAEVLTAANLQRAYGVVMASGTAEGVPFVLPKGLPPAQG